jgi:prepilin-type N-terminal cleavage/methylation domain-containing protein/prepilin-type processing-associated H-X9-DG protein
MNHRRDAFTLIELLVVISIIAVLASMLMGGIALVRMQAKRMVCGSDMRQAGTAFEAYAADNEGLVPYVALIGGPVSTMNWPDYVADYVEANRSSGGAGKIDITKRSILAGCPLYKAVQAYAPGFGMNSYLERTAQAGVAHPSYNRTNRWDLRSPIPANVVNFAWSSITYRSGRALLADATDYHINGLIDVTRHGSKYNMLFVDLHLQPLSTQAQGTQAIDKPDLGVP